MADISLDDDQLREELEKYGEKVSKINDKTRLIYIKKLNHFRAREAMASKAGELQQRKASGRSPSRYSSQLPINTYEKPENNSSDRMYSDERQLRRRTGNNGNMSNMGVTRSAVNGNAEDSVVMGHDCTKAQTRSPGRQKKIFFSTSTPIYDVTTKFPDDPSTKIFSSSPFTNTLNKKRLITEETRESKTSNIDTGFGGSRFGLSTKSYKHRPATEFSDSEGEGLPEMTTKAINTSFSFSDDSKMSPLRSTPSSSAWASSRPTGDGTPSQIFSLHHSKDSKKSNPVSKVVIAGVMIFFAVVAFVYLYKAFFVMTHPSAYISQTKLCLMDKTLGKEICLSEKEKAALEDAIVLLAIRSGELVCGITRTESPDGFVSVLELMNHLIKKYDDVGPTENYEVNMQNLLVFIMNKAEWNITMQCGVKNSCFDVLPGNITALRSERPVLSLTCRVKRAFQLVTINLLLVVSGVLLFAGTIWLIVLLKRQREKKKREIYMMANEIIGLLQNHSAQCCKDPTVKPYIPVSHIRDALVPINDRIKKRHIWNKAVQYIGENETRIIQEVQSISGEEAIVWKWNEIGIKLTGSDHLPNKEKDDKITTPSSSHVTKPQSSEARKFNLLPIDSKLASPCLKVYNAFHDHDQNNFLPECLRDSILDQCGQYHGILHIGCDYNIEEGVVFVKCVSESAASQNYKALHGCVVGDHLISVKYVSPLVYKMVFPDSEDAMVPLKSSTHRRRSPHRGYQ